MRLLLLSTALALATACASATEDRCEEHHHELAFDEPGPWGSSPAEVYAHVEAQRTGTVSWLGGGSLGEMTPGEGSAAVTITTTLPMNSAVGVESEHIGGGRLACIDSMTARAMLTITSDDGALAETVELELVVFAGDGTGEIVGQADLPAQLGGSLVWAPHSTTGGLFIRASWIDDAAQSVRAWLIWGDASEATVSGGAVTVSGTTRVLAEFEANAG
jgi:hypothetical protein